MPTVVDFAPNLGFSAVLAGAATDAADLLEFGPDLSAWPVDVTDYAAVANVGSNTVAATTLSAGGLAKPTNVSFRAPIEVAGANDDIFVAHAVSNHGIYVDRYTSAKTLINTLTIDALGTSVSMPQMFVLEDGNIGIGYSDGGSPQNTKFAIFTPLLEIVQAATVIEANSGGIAAFQRLSGGGFMTTYLKNGTATQRVAVYDNSGAPVTAPATIETWTGSPGGEPPWPMLVELSDLNVGVAINSGYSTSIGLYKGVLGPDGSIVSALASVDGNNTIGDMSIDAFGGFFCITKSDTANVKSRVYSNAGVLQGGAFTFASTARVTGTANDGTDFWMATEPTAGTSMQLVKIPTTGTNFLQLNLGTLGAIPAGGANNQFLIEHERGRLVLMVPDDETWKYAVFNIANSALEVPFTTTGEAGSLSPGVAAMILAGDFSFIAGFSLDASNGNAAFVGIKYANTAIIGVAANTVAAEQKANQRSKANAYVINPVKGTPNKLFDHSATNIHGNKGSIGNNGVTLEGL